MTAAAVHAVLQRRGETVAVAESMTGGMLSASLTEPAGASATFRGGLVVYATDLKSSLVAVPEGLLAAHGPVREEVALALAQGAIRVCGADWGVGLTGVAGPQDHGGRPVGTVCIAVVGPAGRVAMHTSQLAGERGEVRAGAVQAALRVLADELDSGEASP